MKLLKFATAAFVSLAFTSATFAASTKDIVTGAMTELMINKDLAAIDKYFAAPYIQHNQSVPDGIAGLKGLAGAAIANNPAFKYQLTRVMTDGDIGITHGIYTGFGKVPLVGFDVFRVKDGKIVEHWDNLSPQVANNPSGHSQTDGPVIVSDIENTAANKAVVSDFVSNVLIKGAFDKMPNYFDGDNYIQHNSNIADGLSGLGAGLKMLADTGVTMRIAKVHAVHGEGNFVLAMSSGDISGQPTAFFDLFRVENGKIAEHWDVISPILPDAKAANTNGKF